MNALETLPDDNTGVLIEVEADEVPVKTLEETIEDVPPMTKKPYWIVKKFRAPIESLCRARRRSPGPGARRGGGGAGRDITVKREGRPLTTVITFMGKHKIIVHLVSDHKRCTTKINNNNNGVHPPTINHHQVVVMTQNRKNWSMGRPLN
nr:uncharacterized protein LOC111422388 [Onthophagus taurus]